MSLLKNLACLLFMATALFGSEESKFFGAKLVEIDALIAREKGRNSARIDVYESGNLIGTILISRIRRAESTAAADIANGLLAEYTLPIVSKPSTESANDSSYETESGFGRVMRSGREFYIIRGRPRTNLEWQSVGEKIKSLILSFKFN